ncbi:uncharacterized protein F4807DRAFT_469542 [Annulohypoxylon truncatum]|uniref:uncharacterized protein n=1 Tax=Annulohypoxylon truncatum TaxID=327061 RepID=UPI002007B13E|nr:uncharacterized protein F4807DRAFT_469542 [Annulohypoxylon truncatum]KAI1213659.1 hypothetical protein F4807DRAFT_469542 [Annulohypoxylon truncatum]
MTILSDPANRFAIESEQLMAADYYDDPIECASRYSFPITETCALLGASLVLLGPEDWRHSYEFEPLWLADLHGLPSVPSDGLVAIDITDMNNLKYGIMTFRIPADEDAIDISIDNDTTKAISASQYVARYLQHNDLQADDMIKAEELAKFSLITEGLMYFSWPTHDWTCRLFSTPESHLGTRPLVDQCLDVLIHSTSEIESFDMSIFELPLLIPGFKARLQRRLFAALKNLECHNSVGQLLALVFNGATQLPLVQLKGLSAKVLESALKTEELKNVTELSLQVNNFWSSPDHIIDVISCGPSIRHVCFLLGPPEARNSLRSIDLLEAIGKRPELLKRIKVTFTAAYSRMENHMVWNRWGNSFHPPSEVFPILNMMVTCRFGKKGDEPARPIERSLYFGSGLLTAEAFTAGFLRWLPNMPHHDGYPFSVGPSTLGSTSKAEVHPILSYTEDEVFPGGSWVVLVLNDATGETKGKLRVLKYAFVQLDGGLKPIDYRRDWHCGYDVEPDHLREVVGLKGFLQITAPHVDQGLVDRLLLEAGKEVAAKDVQVLQSPESEPFSVMDREEACKLFNEVLAGSENEIRGETIEKGSIRYLPGGVDGAINIKASQTYIKTFRKPHQTVTSAEDLYDKVVEEYPNRIGKLLVLCLGCLAQFPSNSQSKRDEL